jgi:hypothetical protein
MRNPVSLILSFALAACGSAAPAAPQAKPAMWKLSDPDTTIYLFGTVHVLPERLQWRTKKFDETVTGAKELVLEINDQGDPARIAELYKRLAYAPGLPPVLERVPPDKRAQLEALIKKSGFQPSQMDGMETWAVAVAVGASMYRDVGASPDHGVENQLRTSFAGRPIDALETTEQQLGYFDTMPEATQRKLLVSMIEDTTNANAEFQKMLGAWSSGNVGSIARTFDNELKTAPEIAKILIDQRNANWVRWVEQRLDQPGTVLVAVGAGHLAGRGSVIDLLQRQGYKVERVQ